MLVWYIGECKVSIINMNNGIKGPTCGYHNCNSTQKSIHGRYVKVKESFHTLVIICFDTILDHVHIREISPRYEGSYMVYKSKYMKKEYRHIPIP